MGNLWHSCVKAREAIDLPFVAVSGVGPEIGVLNGVPHSLRGREVLGVFLFHCLQSIFIIHRQSRNLFDSCVKFVTFAFGQYINRNIVYCFLLKYSLL